VFNFIIGVEGKRKITDFGPNGWKKDRRVNSPQDNEVLLSAIN
jgi:hypothetical protein